MSQDWKGERYLGLTITWDYTLQKSLSIHARLLSKSWPPFPSSYSSQTTTQTLSPYVPHYGAKQQFVETEDNSALLSKPNKTCVQEVIGVFLYDARAMDCIMLPALGSLAPH
eukprot:CCRYP_007838-RA/>CCRYP_007838-RA protein AED:0.39 eAED:0.39 QI:0/-1/0/1/-1/1/1/0/111